MNISNKPVKGIFILMTVLALTLGYLIANSLLMIEKPPKDDTKWIDDPRGDWIMPSGAVDVPRPYSDILGVRIYLSEGLWSGERWFVTLEVKLDGKIPKTPTEFGLHYVFHIDGDGDGNFFGWPEGKPNVDMNPGLWAWSGIWEGMLDGYNYHGLDG